MIDKFVEKFNKNKESMENSLKEKHPDEYKDLVKVVIQNINVKDDYDEPDPERITVIDDGEYQGTLLFIIGAKGYQPSKYWSVYVNYGSCSGCDTLQGIREYSRKSPTDEQVKDYMTLALHIVQGIKEIK